jgi:hypothetical protein
MSQIFKKISQTGTEQADFLPIGANTSVVTLDRMWVPDWSAQETTNRIAWNTTGDTLYSSTWTVDRVGFVSVVAQQQAGATGNAEVLLYVNSRMVAQASGGYTSTSSGIINAIVRGVYAVSPGDTVFCHRSAVGNGGAGCFFIPPKQVRPSQYNVDIGTNISLDEKPVFVMNPDTGIITQKLDLDGSPIWERTFAGNIPAAAATSYTPAIYLASGVKKLVDASGWWCPMPNINEPLFFQNTAKMLTQGATVSTAALAAAASNTTAITFPIPYQEAPVIQMWNATMTTGWMQEKLALANVTAAGFSLIRINGSNSTAPASNITWRAIGKQYVRQHIAQLSWTDSGDVIIQGFDYSIMDGTGTYQCTLQYTKLA